MEEVEHGRGHSGYALVGVGYGDVPDRVPLVHHQAGLDVDLLNDAVVDQPVARTPVGAEVPMLRLERDEPGGTLAGDLEVVQVGVQAVSGADCRNRDVAGALDHIDALAVPLDDLPLPPRQHRCATVALNLEVERPRARPGRAETHP